MLQSLFSRFRRGPSAPEEEIPGDILVDGVGHREYIGGMWNVIGDLQFKFMCGRGLKPDHVFLDIGCGSLRAGSRFIPYLAPGNYLGIDTKQELIHAGLIELGEHTQRKPEFVVSNNFEFTKFSKPFDYALSQAVFMLLPNTHIEFCFRNLRGIANPGAKFYATFGEGTHYQQFELEAHPYLVYYHTRQQMLSFGSSAGWRSRYIGKWGHPRGQMMVEYTAI